MTLPPPPPLADVLEKYQTLVLPAAGGAALVAVALLAVSRRLAWPAAGLGVLAGLAVANWGTKLVPWAGGGRAADWLGPAAVLLTLTGLATHGLTRLAGLFTGRPTVLTGVAWLPRLVAATAAGPWLVTAIPSEPLPGWAGYALGAAVFLHWLALDLVARPPAVPGSPPQGNRPAHVVFIQAVTLTLAAGLFLYAGQLGLTDLVTIASAALAGVALAGFAAGADVRAAIPVGAVALPGLAMMTRQTATTQVPPAAFWLLASAPLALAVWMLPALHRRDGWAGYVCRWAAVLAVAGAAVVLAARVETLPWEESW